MAITLVLDKPGLYETERHVYDFVCTYLAEHGHGPLFQEIMDGCDLSSKTKVSDSVWRLESNRLLKREKCMARSFQVVPWRGLRII